ncbi:MAG: hypothetical protein GF399_11955 [Candidatus Coatesbacteria bacterium]|nr:hypothetical protein [Candidatus Coatesbacteria bacterium]
MNSILYHTNEGQDNLIQTMDLIAEYMSSCDYKAVIFSSKGDGPAHIHETHPELKSRIIVVTYPFGSLNEEDNEKRYEGLNNIKDLGYEVLSANPSFSDIAVPEGMEPKRRAIIETLRMFGGGMILCVEAILMVRDANKFDDNEIVISACSDTAIVATATRSKMLFYPSLGMEIKEILCKPYNLQLSRSGKNE